jgi:hypothetical protein
MGELAAAAEEYLRAGIPGDALRCYLQIPDFDKTIEPVETLGEHPLQESLVWLRRMRDLASERPAEFPKMILPAEKKLFEERRRKTAAKSAERPACKPRKPSPRAPF